jgi:Trp operon repressor
MNKTEAPNLFDYLELCLQNPDDEEAVKAIIKQGSQALKDYLDAQTTQEDYEKAFDNMLSQVERGVKSLKQQVQEAKDALPKAA